MQSTAYKLENNISIITLVTFLSYVTFVFYKIGNSLYFGYPVNLIWVDFNSLVLTLAQNSIIIVAIFLLLRSAYRSTNGLIHNIFIISVGMIAPMMFFGDLAFEWKALVINLILFSLIFLLNTCLKRTLQEKTYTIFSKWGVRTLLSYLLLVFYIGNYYPTLFKSAYTDENEIIVSTNGSEALLVSCDREGNKVIKIKSILDKKIHSQNNDILVRNWYESECAHFEKIHSTYL
ncbi:hypothetical protein QNS20_004609 [Enterobacter ludwigii]|jgi:hypothetical protein|nr:hypothetical protein [Enterobacter ludwigii]